VNSAYFDTSALVKTLIRESGSATAERAWEAALWWHAGRAAHVETCAALAAARRQRRISAAEHVAAKDALAFVWPKVRVVELSAAVMNLASDLAEREGLRGYDAIHLASALRVADVIVSADVELLAAAQRSGLQVIDART
jgi:predicted nucleic acid-binding protein